MFLIPKNVSSRYEFFQGFGFRELYVSLAGLIVGVILFFLVGLFTSSGIRIFLIVIPTAVAFYYTRPHPLTKQPLYMTYLHQRQWMKGQRRYYYQFGRGRVDVPVLRKK